MCLEKTKQKPIFYNIEITPACLLPIAKLIDIFEAILGKMAGCLFFDIVYILVGPLCMGPFARSFDLTHYPTMHQPLARWLGADQDWYLTVREAQNLPEAYQVQ